MSKYKYFSDEQDITTAGRWIVERQNRFLLRLIARHLPSPTSPSVLEIGPGHGAFARACKEHGFPYEAVEANPSMAERLQQDGFQVSVSAVPPLPAGERRSVIVMQHVLEHMQSVDAALSLVSQCASRLVPGGVVIVCGPDITVMKDDFFDCDYTHVFPTSGRRLRQLLHDGGFEVVDSGFEHFAGRHPAVVKTMALFARVAYSTGLLSLIFGDKAYNAKTALYAACYAVGSVAAKKDPAAAGSL
jgi:hypothetical protein